MNLISAIVTGSYIDGLWHQRHLSLSPGSTSNQLHDLCQGTDCAILSFLICKIWRELSLLWWLYEMMIVKLRARGWAQRRYWRDSSSHDPQLKRYSRARIWGLSGSLISPHMFNKCQPSKLKPFEESFILPRLSQTHVSWRNLHKHRIQTNKKSLLSSLKPTLCTLLRKERPGTWPCSSWLSTHSCLHCFAGLA